MLLIIFSQFIIKLFDFTPLGQHYAILIIAVYGIFMPVKVYNGLNIVGTMRCGGDTKFAMFVESGSVLAYWCAACLFWCIIPSHLPVYFVVLMAQFEEIVKCFICTKRFFKNG